MILLLARYEVLNCCRNILTRQHNTIRKPMGSHQPGSALGGLSDHIAVLQRADDTDVVCDPCYVRYRTVTKLRPLRYDFPSGQA